MSNTNELQKSGLDSGQIETLAKAGVIPANTPVAIVQVFAHACKEHALSPFKKEIYLVKYGSQYSTIVGIDGFRTKAARTGQYAGSDDIKFDVQADGSFATAAQLKAAGKLPVTATATVYRIVGGVRCPFTHTAVFAEFYGTAAAYSKAVSMPFQMISKVAEGFALKKGFSDELAGLHIEEEAAAFTGETISAQTAQNVDPEKLRAEIKKCDTVQKLFALYQNTPGADVFAEEFTDRKFELNPEAMLQQTKNNDGK